MRKRNILMAVILSICNIFSVSAITLKEATLSESRPKGVAAMVSSADGENYYQLNSEHNAIIKYSYRTGKAVETVFDATAVKSCPSGKWDGFEISADENKILLYRNSKPIYRYSFEAEYYIYEPKRNNFRSLTDKGLVQGATFSPDGLMVAFVYQNNIYLKKLSYNSEVAVTTDGVVNKIINGIPDWVYQEEFGILNSIKFSPDNMTLAFMQWNESEVGTYDFPIYEGAVNRNKEYELYPGSFAYKYPKAGTKNSEVKVFSYNIDNRTLLQMNLPQDTYYVANIEFGATPDRLMIMGLNRDQNQFKLYSANPRSAKATLIYSDNSKSWIEIEDIIKMTRFYENTFVIPSEKSGFNHLYLYNNSGSLVKQITSGNYDVTDFYGLDARTGTYYFQSAIDGAINRTVCSINAKGVMTKLSKQEGWNSAIFNNTMSNYLLNYSSVKVPMQYVLYSIDGKKIRDVELNSVYANRFADVPQKEFFTFQSDGNTLNGYMIKPADFNPSKKYPVILSQYSGPGSQRVRNRWEIDWENYAATQGYIVVCVDGRGTGARGLDWKSKVYLHLGKYESIDQCATANYMASQPYVDGKRIGIYGWSFGGYETLMAMSQPNAPFACGVSIAPVTDWKHYDTIYGERFMRTPQSNPEGYKQSSAINAIPNLKGRVLLMAGTADDNVHITNMLQYAAELTAQNKICDMMIYVNMNHSINGGDTRLPLYTKVLDFFDTYLKK